MPPDDSSICKNETGCPHSANAAKEAVRLVFSILGVDVDDPAAVEDFREDLRFGRKLRSAADKSLLAFFGAVGVAIAAAIWSGLQSEILHRTH